jgi:hypothetical protein
MDSFHLSGYSSLFQIELITFWIADTVESVLSEFNQYLAIYTFSTLQWQFQLQDDWGQGLMVQLNIVLYA